MRIELTSLYVYLMVFVRMAGMLAFNPLFSRRNIPSMVRTGLAFFLTMLLAPGVDPGVLEGVGGPLLVFILFKELAMGALLGFVFQIFYYLLFFVGDYLDTAFGMSMAKVFDPNTNVQMSLTSNFLSILFMLYILATDSHLVLLHLFASSLKLVPVGGAFFTAESAKYIIELFIQVFHLIIRLILPFAVGEFALEASMGVLMKLIPQVTIFVINFQLKMGLGFIMMILFLPVTSSFIDHYVVNMLDALQQSLLMLSGA